MEGPLTIIVCGEFSIINFESLKVGNVDPKIRNLLPFRERKARDQELSLVPRPAAYRRAAVSCH